MKYALSALALASAAPLTLAQGAQVEPLSYNRFGVTRIGDVNHLEISSFIGGSDFFATLSSNSYFTNLGLGYVFKDAFAGFDIAFTATGRARYARPMDTEYGIILRRRLDELVPGLEVMAGYNYANYTDDQEVFLAESSVERYYVELAYNIDKRFQVAVGAVETNEFDPDKETKATFSVRYNF